MIMPSVIAFSLVAAAFVWLAGRRDSARDPRLTLVTLGLLAIYPLFSLLPKVSVPGVSGINLGWAGWLGWVWAGGVVLFSLRLFAALAQLTMWRRRSVAVEDAGFSGHKPEIRMLDGLACPVAAGLFRPIIFVPTAWHEWSPALRKTVVAHEAAHHARRDPLWRAVAAITCALHWFNPLVWWMSARLADQCEYACDERVLEQGVAAQGYASHLCDVAAVCRAPATALAMASHHGLEARVRRMLKPPMRRPQAGVVGLALLTFSTAVALAIIERGPAEVVPGIDVEEFRMRLSADPFPGD